MTFSLQTFGNLQLLDADGRIVTFPEKGLLVLVYLLSMQRETERRTTLARILWSSAGSDVAQVNLRKAIWRIRSRQSQLGVEFLTFTEGVASRGKTPITSDLLSLQGRDLTEPVARLGRLVALFDQPYLGPVRCQSPDFERWLVQCQNHHSDLLKALLKEAAASARGPEDDEIIKRAAILIFRTEPQDPDTLQLLIQLFNAEEEVEYFRTYFEQRKKLLSRALDASRTTVGRNSTKKAPVARRPTASSISITSVPSSPKKYPRTVIPRLALLPPNNAHRDPMVGILASSLIEDVTIGFCALNSLEVIAPHTAIQISNRSEEQPDTFKRYDINYVLDTRLSGADDNDISLFVQLIHADSAEIIWAERYQLDKSQLMRRRRDLSRRIALSVVGRIENDEITRTYIERNAVAYHRYLVGRHYLNRLTLPNLRRARKELKAALADGQDFAPVLTSLARTYSKEWLLTARGDVDLLKTAAAYATRAIEIRNDSADGHRELGIANLLQGSIDESVSALELSETLSPHYADIIADHADTLVHFSRPDLAMQKIERAIQLNPMSPDSYLWTAAGASYCLGDFIGALGYIDEMEDGDLADRLSAASWAMLGNDEKATFFVHRAREANPQFDVDKWLSVVPLKEQWQKDIYREGLKKAGF